MLLIIINVFSGSSLQTIIHNHEQIQDGEQIISNYLKKEFDKVYPEDIANSVIKYLTTEEMLSHIGSHIGLKDIILTNVSYFTILFSISNFKKIVHS